MTVNLKTPQEIMREIADRAQARRLALRLTQIGLARRSGVSLGSVKRFEHTGKIAIESLLKIALVLDGLNEFENFFAGQINGSLPPLDVLLKETKTRKRGRLS